MRDIVKECRKIASQYNCKVYFRQLNNTCGGQSLYDQSIILINNKCSNRQEILSLLFHEIAHIECFKKGKWKEYHEGEDFESRLKTAVRAERWCDRWAEMELYNYDKRIKYISGYEERVKNKDFDREVREFLAGFIKECG